LINLRQPFRWSICSGLGWSISPGFPYRKFPKISINDLKQKVKDKCGDEWFKLVEKIKAPTEYPSRVGISRYYLKVTGQRKDNRQTVTKLIII
jgi:hypothetical protein